MITLVLICCNWNRCESKLLSVTCGITLQEMKKCWQGNKRRVGLGAQIVPETWEWAKKNLKVSKFSSVLGAVMTCLSGTQACN